MTKAGILQKSVLSTETALEKMLEMMDHESECHPSRDDKPGNED